MLHRRLSRSTANSSQVWILIELPVLSSLYLIGLGSAFVLMISSQ